MLTVRASFRAAHASRDHCTIIASIQDTQHLLPIEFASYLALIDWTGRAFRHDKKGAIPDSVAPILIELGIETTQWITAVRQFNQRFYTVAGSIEVLHSWCERLQQSRLKSFSFSRQIFQ